MDKTAPRDQGGEQLLRSLSNARASLRIPGNSGSGPLPPAGRDQSMYESRFGISGPPFQLSPDPNFYFDSRGHHRALSALRRGLKEDVRLMVVSGEVGAGKTTLVRTLLGELGERPPAVSHLVSTQLNVEELLGSVLIGFGLAPDGGSQDVLMSKLNRFLSRLAMEARRAVLIVDEAQNLHPEAFERLVAMATPGPMLQHPVQVCLIGQPELRSMLETGPMQGMRARIGVSVHLGPIEQDEAQPYVEHRLRRVGWAGTPNFEPAAFDEIYRWTLGVPRRMNLLCNRLLLSCFLNGETNINSAKVAHTGQELRAEISGDSLADSAMEEWQPVAVPTQREDSPQSPHPVSLHALVRPGVRISAADVRPVLCVAAGASDHIKAAAVLRAMAKHADVLRAQLVHVYSDEAFEISRALFDGLDIHSSVIHLGVARDGDNVLSDVMRAFQRVVDQLVPRALVVFDGGEGALVCGSVASSRDIPVIHIGAGLRTNPVAEAGQVARQSIDQLADLLYTTDAQASATLLAEGIAAERVHCVGNLLVDALQLVSQTPVRPAAADARPSVAEPYLVHRNGYGLVVINQPLNLESTQSIQDCLVVLNEVSRDLHLVWPMQQTTAARLKHHQLYERLAEHRITCLPSLPYADYVALLRAATCVLTDSWSVQEEATVLSIPCITLGRRPDREITVSVGSNVFVGSNHALAARVVWECIFGGGKRGRVPELWDGRAGHRIASYLRTWVEHNTGDQLPAAPVSGSPFQELMRSLGDSQHLSWAVGDAP
jgi:general secretion pathway protein A